MNDLEDRLRADFLLATANVEDLIDADEALLAGQRARSSRLGVTVGVMAMAAVAGLVGWTVLRVVPIQGGVPAPRETISAIPSPPATASDPMSTTFDLSAEAFGGNPPGYDSITFKITSRTSGSYFGIVTLLKDGHPTRTWDFSAPSGRSWSLPWTGTS